MPSLSQIVLEKSPLLVIDAASETIQAGLLCTGAAPRWSSRTEEAGIGVFACLEELGVNIDSIRGFAFCEAPGSILGIRTAAMAIRMWNVLTPRPVFAYNGLAVVAQGLDGANVAVIADARRGFWHRFLKGGSFERVPAGDLTGDLRMPQGFRHWSPLPSGVSIVPYELAQLLSRPDTAAADLFRETDAPDAFLHLEPEYAKWVPQIHRGP